MSRGVGRLFAISSLTLLWLTASAIPVSPTDPHIRYVGRFDYRDADGPRCAWSASMAEVAFNGTGLKIKVRDTGQDYIQVVVDGSPTAVLAVEKADETLEVADGLSAGNHLVQLVKRTEADQGVLQFLGFEVDGVVKDPPVRRRVIEVIGDSISCGYGNEGKGHEEHFKPETENAYLSYGAIASRELNADFFDIAWSGRKMWPDNTMPELYDLALPSDKTSEWNLRQSTPDVFVINLGTNDFGVSNPDEKKWTEAYAAFIGRLRERAPHARIYCAIGPMMSDTWPPNNHALSTIRGYLDDVVALRASAGDRNVSVLEFEMQNEARDGIGSDWHPSIATHKRMADLLVQAIRKDLHW